MPTRIRLSLLIVALAASLAGAQNRTQVELVNGRADADYVEVFTNGSARLRGNVTLHAERLGPDNAVADVTADTVTVLAGRDTKGQTSITKLFAAGKVHIEATTRDAARGETRHVVSDCDRVTYLGSDQVVHFLTETATPVTAKLTVEVVPTATNNAKEAHTYDLVLTARKTLDFRLSGEPVEATEPAGPAAPAAAAPTP